MESKRKSILKQKEEAELKVQQYQHRIQLLENRKKNLEKKAGKQRTHHLCNMGGAIQSISKVITLAVALEKCGFYKVFEKVGMEPSGDAFNSLVKLDVSSDHPFNPMINSGAIAITSYLLPLVSFDDMLEITRQLCMDPDIVMDGNVYQS